MRIDAENLNYLRTDLNRVLSGMRARFPHDVRIVCHHKDQKCVCLSYFTVFRMPDNSDVMSMIEKITPECQMYSVGHSVKGESSRATKVEIFTGDGSC